MYWGKDKRMVSLTIDDRLLEIEAGKTILDAAHQVGIWIPCICWHESLSAAGSCRICTVEVITSAKAELTAACNYPVEDGLKVNTDSEVVREARRLAMEMLLAQRPHSTVIKELAQRLGVEQPDFTLQQKECILCKLCVRACYETVGLDAITFVAQGKERDVTEPAVLHSRDKCIGCNACAYICPTEAITVDDVGGTRIIKTPSGHLEFRLKKCSVCGKYWAPEKQLDYITRTWNLEPDLFDTCPDCRE